NLQGAGRDKTFITCAGSTSVLNIAPDSTAINNEEVIRVTGFTFDGNNVGGGGNGAMVWIQGAGASASKPFKNLAIGNNRFKNAAGDSTTLYSRGQTRGCIYGNIFDRCNIIIRPGGNDDLTEWFNGHFPQSFGTADNLYFENNRIQWSSSYGGSAPGWTEG